jgi:hypothetical protein
MQGVLALAASFGIALLGDCDGSGAAPAAHIVSQWLPHTTAIVDDETAAICRRNQRRKL